MPKPLEVFYSYAHEDEALRDQLEKHLRILQRQNLISSWHDRKITPGREWEGKIDEHLESAHVILLLVSSDFIDSDYCYDVEMTRAMERHEAGEAKVIPIILRRVDWKGAPFEKLQALPTDAKPVASWDDIDDAFTNIAKGIRRAVEELQQVGGASGSNMETETRTQEQACIWNVPHNRNRNFTGRKSQLDKLRKTLISGKPATLIQTLHGLGGVGKTQIAIEYTYRYRDDYDLVWWLNCEETVKLTHDYIKLIERLNLPARVVDDPKVKIEAVKRWLETTNRWLLIFDNVSEPIDIQVFLPSVNIGHILITSRNPSWRGISTPFNVDTMPRKESIQFLIKRTGQKNKAGAAKVAEALGDLPLALEQAGALIERSGMSYEEYLSHFQNRRSELWAEEQTPLNYRATVTTTWDLNIEQAQQESPASTDLLYMCAYLHPDNIPLWLFEKPSDSLPVSLADTIECRKAMMALRHYSLIELTDTSLSVHRLVQAVVQDRIAKGT